MLISNPLAEFSSLHGFASLTGQMTKNQGFFFFFFKFCTRERRVKQQLPVPDRLKGHSVRLFLLLHFM